MCSLQNTVASDSGVSSLRISVAHSEPMSLLCVQALCAAVHAWPSHLLLLSMPRRSTACSAGAPRKQLCPVGDADSHLCESADRERTASVRQEGKGSSLHWQELQIGERRSRTLADVDKFKLSLYHLMPYCLASPLDLLIALAFSPTALLALAATR